MSTPTIAVERPRAEGFSAPEIRALTAVVPAHFVSHIFYLVLPPLFPLLRDRLGVGFVELGFGLTVYNLVTVLFQMPVGILVDRIGPRFVLATGLLLGGACYIAIGLWPSYPVILAAMAVGGLGNCSFHPADYSMMTASVSGQRIGRAFSIHLFAGYMGTAVAPAGMLLFATLFGLQGAIIAAGLLAPLAALLLPFAPPEKTGRTQAKAGTAAAPARIFTPLILALTGFFLLFSLSMTGINNFSVAALTDGASLTLGFATTILSVTLFLSAAGILAGGVLADRTTRHGAVASVAYVATAILIGAIALVPMGGWPIFALMAVAGFLSGLIQPSRDMIVRSACPPGAEGRVFGVVTTGFNVGGSIGPLLFGYALDHGHPLWIFGLTALVMAMTAAASVLADRRATRA